MRVRPQFSLRALLLLILVVGIALGWFANVYRQKLAERAAVARLRAAGAVVCYDYEVDEDWLPLDTRTQSVELPGPKFLRDLLGDDWFATPVCVHGGRDWSRRVETPDPAYWDAELRFRWLLSRHGKTLDPGAVEALSPLPHLRRLHLEHVPLKESDLDVIRRLRRLRHVYLPPQLSDAAVDQAKAALPQANVQHLAYEPTWEERLARLEERCGKAIFILRARQKPERWREWLKSQHEPYGRDGPEKDPWNLTW